jgi:hypothetical protein
MRVVFPEPFGPRRPRISPFITSSDTESSTSGAGEAWGKNARGPDA